MKIILNENKFSVKFLLLIVVSFLTAACNFEVVTTKGGRIISNPSGIDCRYNEGKCIVKDYERLGDKNDAVITKLTAIPDDGYQFSRWRGCDETKLLNCYKLMEGDIKIRAYFEPLKYATEAANPGKIRFVSLGDFGTGSDEQKLVGDAIAELCNGLDGGCNFALGLGDNMYDKNPLDDGSYLFEEKFEEPYQNIDFPFYMSLGNHDNSLLINGIGQYNRSGDIQVNYHYRDDRPSEKWVMPRRYYKHKHYSAGSIAAPLAEFYALDSNPFMSVFETSPEYHIYSYQIRQATWIRNALTNSKATWKIAYGHHPFLSNGEHGNAGRYDGIHQGNRVNGGLYREWLLGNVCGKVDLFIAGHDHDLQILHSVPECGNTMFIISGATANPRSLGDRSPNPVWYQKDNQLGFVLSEIEGNILTNKVYTVDASSGQATLKYQKSFPRRKLN